MRLMTRDLAAVIALIDLVAHQQNGPVTLGQISQRIDLSISYLQQIFGALRNCGIVDGMRGPGGGYSLARPAREVTVAAIMQAVESLHIAKLRGGKERTPYGRHSAGAVRAVEGLCIALNRKAMAYLATVSLKDLVDQANASKKA